MNGRIFAPFEYKICLEKYCDKRSLSFIKEKNIQSENCNFPVIHPTLAFIRFRECLKPISLNLNTECE